MTLSIQMSFHSNNLAKETFSMSKLFESLHLQENASKHEDMSGPTNIIKNN